jgi:hypothetical protein
MPPVVAEAIQDRARLLLASSTEGLRLWALARFQQLAARTRERFVAQGGRLPAEARVAVQRFGSQLWQRVTVRFPGLADLHPAAATHEPEPPAAVQVWQRTTRGRAGSQLAYDVPTLLLALRDPSAEVAAAAATVLGACTEESTQAQCHAALLEALENHDGYFSPLTRVAALQSLVHRLGAPPTPPELAPLLQAVRDLDAEVSMAAIAAVAAHAPARVVLDHLFPVAFDETNFFLPMVRSAATRALERAGLLTSTQAAPAT